MSPFNRTVGARMNQVFIDDLQLAEEVTLAAFRQRSWWQRLMERGASLVMRVL